MKTMTEPQSAKGAAVEYTDLREYLKLLEAKKLLHRVKCEVDPTHEIGAIAALRSSAKARPWSSKISRAIRACCW